MEEIGRKIHLNKTLILSVVEPADLKMNPKCKICNNDDELFYVLKKNILGDFGFHICVDCLNIISQVQEIILD